MSLIPVKTPSRASAWTSDGGKAYPTRGGMLAREQRYLHCLPQRPVVVVDRGDRRLEIVRRTGHDSGRAEPFRLLRERDRLRGGGSPAAHPDVGLARHVLDHDLDQAVRAREE